MKRIFKIFFIVLIVAFAGMQFIRPDRTNPVSDPKNDISAVMNVPQDIQSILDRSCYDCHSNKTKWPWYSNIAPVSWLVANDTKLGREHLNFSEWGKYNSSDRESNMDDIYKIVKKGEMPIKKYLLMHSEAKLSDADIDKICKWAKSFSGEDE